MGALTAGFFLAYLVVLPPHLVHHLFDKYQESPTCLYLAQSQNTPWLETDGVTLPLPIQTGTLSELLSSAFVPSPALTNSHQRAPPHPALSA